MLKHLAYIWDNREEEDWGGGEHTWLHWHDYEHVNPIMFKRYASIAEGGRKPVYT